jgi:hypothetical protein
VTYRQRIALAIALWLVLVPGVTWLAGIILSVSVTLYWVSLPVAGLAGLILSPLLFPVRRRRPVDWRYRR